MKARNLYRKIELLIATIVTGFCLFVALTNGNYSRPQYEFAENHIQYDFYTNYLQPSLFLIFACYLIFVFLTQYVEPKTKGFLKVTLLICCYLLLAVVMSVSLTYISAWKYGVFDNWRDATVDIFSEGFGIAAITFFMYLIYYGIKELLFNLSLGSKIKEMNRTRWMIGSVSVLAWFLILAMLGGGHVPNLVMALWGVILPYALLMIYIHVFWLIPSLTVKNPKTGFYLSRIVPITLLINLIAAIFCNAISRHMPIIAIYILLLLWTGAIIIPMAWWIYKNRSEKLGLQTALGSSQANLSFLRSQINPHFLFNALNTLYGTALQEHADRTGEGIQKLGDMMRFMLHENVQDKILLIRETEYLKNYIDLQNLRVVSSPNITIQTKIEEPASSLQISPMLLIPFVENAYKHGISLRDTSYITIGLHTQGNTLYFDVQNSIHLKPDGDPEKLKSGIGLQNVKERLQLEYPNRHELVIRQTAKEFFVHLTITL